MRLEKLMGTPLGAKRVRYSEDDVILYALAVGAGAEDLDLIYEGCLRTLPAFATTLGLWAPDALSALGVFTPDAALHGAQELEVREPLPTSGNFEMLGKVAGVWDKGRSAVVDVEVECPFFRAVYSIFLPGRGGWGGERGQGAPVAESNNVGAPTWSTRFATSPQQAALYRLTGDRHLIHIDPDAARRAGLPGVILHGLCTLGIAAREVAAAVNATPTALRYLRARFAAPLRPGEELDLSGSPAPGGGVDFRGTRGATGVLSAAHARFDPPLSMES